MTKEISETINFIWVVAKTAADKCQKQKQKLLMKLLVHASLPFPRCRNQWTDETAAGLDRVGVYFGGWGVGGDGLYRLS